MEKTTQNYIGKLVLWNDMIGYIVRKDFSEYGITYQIQWMDKYSTVTYSYRAQVDTMVEELKWRMKQKN